ncbi:hypothetical protein TNCV_3009511 [Trichonephila clavipes]|nr:hypothetical protein TNCV_3009511 [Trichonephila clavipes]
MPPARQSQIQAREIHPAYRLEFLSLSLALTLSTMQVTVRFSSVPPPFRGRKLWGWPGRATPLFTFHQPHERTCGSTVI